ncbi:MAG: O-antigen ligase domain-containing protein [Gemmobacter sp.]
MTLTNPSAPVRAPRSSGQAGAVKDFFAALLAARKGIAFPVLLYLLAILLPLQLSVGGLFLTSARVVLLILVIPLLIGLFSGRYGKVNAIDILFLLHVVWMTIALAVNNPDRVVANAGSTGIEFLGGYLVGRAFIRTREDFLALINLLGLAALCLLPFALVELLTGNAVILNALRQIPGVSTLRDISIGRRMGFDRVQLVFNHPIHSGLFFAVLFPLVFVGMKNVWSDARRLVTTAAILFCGFAALSAGALLAMVMQLFLMTWAWLFRGTKKRWWIMLGVVAVLYVVVDMLSDRTPLRVFLHYATFSAHTAYWRTIIFDWGMANVIGDAARGIPPSPLFGIGLNDWIRPNYMRSGSMDNFWLVTTVRYGIPGFALLALGYALGLWWAMRRNFDSDPVLWQFRRAWVFAFAGLSFTLTTVHVWHSIYSLVFFFFGAGIWLLTATPETRGEAEPEPATDPARNATPFSRFPRSHRREHPATPQRPFSRDPESLPPHGGSARPVRQGRARDPVPRADPRRPRGSG